MFYWSLDSSKITYSLNNFKRPLNLKSYLPLSDPHFYLFNTIFSLFLYFTRGYESHYLSHSEKIKKIKIKKTTSRKWVRTHGRKSLAYSNAISTQPLYLCILVTILFYLFVGIRRKSGIRQSCMIPSVTVRL